MELILPLLGTPGGKLSFPQKQASPLTLSIVEIEIFSHPPHKMLIFRILSSTFFYQVFLGLTIQALFNPFCQVL